MSARPALTVVRTPDKPGPGPMPEPLLRAMDLTIGRRIEGFLSGDYRANVPGLGTELARIRPYDTGDDPRRIDWNATARTGETHVRVQIAERSLATWLVLDTSPSMNFGTTIRRKADTAEGVAMAVAHAATRRGNRLGILTFGGPRIEAVPPKQGRAGLLAVLEGLRREAPADGVSGPGLEGALAQLAVVAKQRGLIVVLSDFRGANGWQQPALALASRHAVLAIEIRDPREQELPNAGELHLVDPESGRLLRVDTSDRKLRERFAIAAAEDRATVTRDLRNAGIDHLVLSTEGDWLRMLALHLRKKGTHL